MALHDNLKKLREENNLTQQQLADRLFVSRQTVCRWENGSRCPDLLTAKKLAMELNISLDELISDEDVKASEDRLCFWQSEKFKSEKKLQQYQQRILNFIQIAGSIYLVITIYLRTQLNINIPVWCTILGLCVIITALIINFVISKKMGHL